MKLSLGVCVRDDANEEQTKLYVSHPLSEDFVSLMTSVLTTSRIPIFISPIWVVWWLHSQEEYTEVEVVYECFRAPHTCLLTKDLVRVSSKEGPTVTSAEKKLVYTDFTGLHDQMCYIDSNVVDFNHLWHAKCDINTKYVVRSVTSNINVKFTTSINSLYNVRHLMSSPNFYDRRVDTISLSTRHNTSSCILHNTLTKGMDEFTTWHHEEGSPLRYFIEKIHRAKLCVSDGHVISKFKVEYTVVSEWAYHLFMGHHVDMIEAYSNEHWSLDELKMYAKDTWDVVGNSREDIVSKVKKIIFNSSDWVDQLTIDKLVSK